MYVQFASCVYWDGIKLLVICFQDLKRSTEGKSGKFTIYVVVSMRHKSVKGAATNLL